MPRTKKKVMPPVNVRLLRRTNVGGESLPPLSVVSLPHETAGLLIGLGKAQLASEKPTAAAISEAARDKAMAEPRRVRVTRAHLAPGSCLVRQVGDLLTLDSTGADNLVACGLGEEVKK